VRGRRVRLNRPHVGAKRLHVGGIRITSGANRDVDRRSLPKRRKQLESHELAKAALETISVDRGMLVARHDDPDTRKLERGSEDAHIEVRGPNSLPLSKDGL